MAPKEKRPITGKILVVDDKTPVAAVLSEFLDEQGHEITAALTGADAMRQIRDEAYDVLLTDLRLPDLGEQEEFFGDLKLPQFAK